MRLRRLFVFLWFAAATLCSAQVSTQSRPWDREVHLTVGAASKIAFVAILTDVAAKAGLVRTPAAPGLKELTGRKVVFYSFGRSAREMLLTVTDIHNDNELVVRAYLDPPTAVVIEQVLEETLHRATGAGIKLKSDRVRK